MEDLIKRAIQFAKDNGYDIYLPGPKDDDKDVNTIRIVGKEKAVYFEIE